MNLQTKLDKHLKLIQEIIDVSYDVSFVIKRCAKDFRLEYQCKHLQNLSSTLIGIYDSQTKNIMNVPEFCGKSFTKENHEIIKRLNEVIINGRFRGRDIKECVGYPLLSDCPTSDCIWEEWFSDDIISNLKRDSEYVLDFAWRLD